jgi:DNA (cytosine-5)-methyltransferase 1
MRSQVDCVDLFCGAGGLTHGLMRGGINVLAGFDIDAQCRFPYEINNSSIFIRRDISRLTSQEILEIYGDAKYRLLAGCAPCQPFSTYSRSSRKHQDNKKWNLVYEYGRLVRETQPEFVTMENVPQLAKHKVFHDFCASLKNYHVWFKVIDCVRYGIPQTRKRLVLLASRFGPIELVSEKPDDVKKATVYKAISHLPPINAGTSDPNDPLHVSCSLSEINLRRIRASKPGGTWRDWDSSLLTSCHQKNSGQTYPSVYGRMEWDAPSPTITTQCFGYGNGRFGHPEQDRAISLREAAILQTFPENYQFSEPNEKIYFNRLGKLIGNAVPVRLGEIIARSILEHLSHLD